MPHKNIRGKYAQASKNMKNGSLIKIFKQISGLKTKK